MFSHSCLRPKAYSDEVDIGYPVWKGLLRSAWGQFRLTRVGLANAPSSPPIGSGVICRL